MTIGQIRTSALIAGALALLFAVSPAHAQFNTARAKCSRAIAKAGLGYVKAKMKLIQKCRNAALKDGSTCTLDPEKVTKIETKLSDTIGKTCGPPFAPANFKNMGFPGPCADATPASFTLAELQQCMLDSHEAIVDKMILLQYDATLPAMLGKADLACQSEVAKQAGAFEACLLKSVQKCRDAINKGKDLGIPNGDFCASDDEKTLDTIAKCEGKLGSGIAKKCDGGQITSLKICTPDTMDTTGAAACLDDTHTLLTDTPAIDVSADLIDYEYATRGGLCGDNVINNLNEECDGTDDDACPGQCGAPLSPNGHFACLCKTKARMVIEEHSNADTDNGWKGTSVDGGVIEGGDYLVDLYDCDGGGNCIAGPNCSGAPHSPCAVPAIHAACVAGSNHGKNCNVASECPGGICASAAFGTTSDSICAALGQGTCRKERTASGPHCFLDPNIKCDMFNPNNPAICAGPGNFCQTTYHGPPVPAAAGGVAVCNVSIISEDVVGTVNINDGTGAVKIRQKAITRFPTGPQNRPCPVCGGFCSVSRNRCDPMDNPCPMGEGICITALVCSHGVNQDKACRATAPFGGESLFFGTTSVDCPPPGQDITNGGLDINANPRTTGSVTLLPTFSCTDPAFSGNTCLGGTSEGRPCTVASQCPGGTCSPQCFCQQQLKPNDCSPACVGGPNDKNFCDVDSECPSGFCHPGDCRLDPLDLDSNQEGICSSGPTPAFCSVTTFHACNPNNGTADCEAPLCPFCELGETCVPHNAACFINSGITRTGTPRTPNGESASVYCVPSTNGGSIDASAGFPGPGALIQRETVYYTP